MQILLFNATAPAAHGGAQNEAAAALRRGDKEGSMKKIPTLFERTYENHRVAGISNKVYPGMEWVLDGGGVATVKIDGSCCAIIG